MRNLFVLKSFPRSPMKTLLTFFLIASASFTLFSRVADYTITMRETKNAESYYHGVAALDNTVPEIDTGTGYYIPPGSKPWPTKEELEVFSSLPGVTLADTRYKTAGLAQDYKMLYDENDIGKVMLEGVYAGYEEKLGSDYIGLKFEDIKVIASERDIKIDSTMQIGCYALEEMSSGKNPFARSYFNHLKAGTRCLLMCTNEYMSNYVADLGQMGLYERPEEVLRVIDGLGEDYLETEELVYQKEWAKMMKQNSHIFDVVYTSDMRAIPRFNERGMVIVEGRSLTVEDMGTKACVVNKLFLEKNNLSIGDTVCVRLGDFLWPQLGSAKDVTIERKTKFADDIELTIVGAYSMVDDMATRLSESNWCYTPNAVFVPGSLLPVEVPDNYETFAGEFSVFIEDAHDIETFREAAEPMAAEMDLAMRFSDGGWGGVKDSFETGSLASFLTTILYIIGAILALFFAVYLYIGRSKKDYAIMRMLGVPAKKAGDSVVLPQLVLSAVAIHVGGIAGLFFAQDTAMKAFAGMEGVPEGFVPDASIPVCVVAVCLAFEICFTLFAVWLFLRKMKKAPPLELLQEGATRTGILKKADESAPELGGVPAEFEIEKLFTDKRPENKSYGSLRQVSSYILRHMWRGSGKTAISLAMAVTLSAGIGMFVFLRLTYLAAYHQVDVKGRATEFSSDMITELAESDLVKDLYCYESFEVHADGMEAPVSLTVTNDVKRYLTDSCKVNYAKEYDEFIFDGTGQVCLVGQDLAKALGIQAGDEIGMLSNDLYTFLGELYGEGGIITAAQKAGKMYKVVGIVETGDTDLANGIFTGIRSSAESVYGQPFPIGYCEFILADNDRLGELNSLLDKLKDRGLKYATMASFHVDGGVLKNIARVRDLLETLFPLAMAAAVLIGVFGPLLVIHQSAQEAAFLRILGVTRKRARCMLAFEQIVLCIVGTTLVSVGIALLEPGLFARSAQLLAVCFGLYLLGGVCGAVMAAVQVTRHKVLELTQGKE